ncbi:acetyl esterase/lipase [Geodermatophilus normandii]|uniref:Acetyl esterase/lipase n=1 Tax=Geodermatophilus normandii TaxID=1137989 RepID=A0A317QPE5_9ACTN|nr:alpha/beta hydrolase fold domain-containing protein [Geodermatophilus normandii]PWW24873.1 acetyl esterase/lipase [Geodermatophilus normandii]
MRVGLDCLVAAGLAGHVAGSRAFHAARGERRGPASLEELREARAQQVPAAPTAGVTVEQVADASGRAVPVRIASPATRQLRGVYLDVPGGGFTLGSAAGGDARDAALAESLGIAVVGVEHRLAPEDPWPAAPDDCEAAALWLLDHAGVRLGTTALAIGGSSAGATLAVTTLLRLRDRGLADRVCGAVLQFGTHDLSGRTPTGRRIAGEYFLEAHVGHVADRTAPDVSPVFGDLHGLPPTLLVVGALDILLEDNLVMAARPSAAGNEVDLRVYPESPHGFTGHPTGMARAALGDRDAWLTERLAAARVAGGTALRPAAGTS